MAARTGTEETEDITIVRPGNANQRGSKVPAHLKLGAWCSGAGGGSAPKMVEGLIYWLIRAQRAAAPIALLS